MQRSETVYESGSTPGLLLARLLHLLWIRLLWCNQPGRLRSCSRMPLDRILLPRLRVPGVRQRSSWLRGSCLGRLRVQERVVLPEQSIGGVRRLHAQARRRGALLLSSPVRHCGLLVQSARRPVGVQRRALVSCVGFREELTPSICAGARVQPFEAGVVTPGLHRPAKKALPGWQPRPPASVVGWRASPSGTEPPKKSPQ
jgi:hypothetical protein